MRPASGSAIFRPDLGMAVMEFSEGDSMGFIGTQLMPIFKTSLNSSSYPVIPKEALLTVPVNNRAPRGAYHRDDFEYERGYFQTSEKGCEEPMDDTERKLFDQEAPGIGDMVATERAYKKNVRAQEKRIADKLFNETNFTAHGVTNEWDDATNATPINDINDANSALRLQCGMTADALVIAYSTFINLKNCDQIVDRLKYTFPGIDINRMSSEQLAAVFNVPKVLIGGSIYNSAKKGQDATITDLWSNEYAMLLKISNGPDLTQPGVGRTFLWTADSPTDPIVEQYREEQIRSDIFRVRHHVDEAFIQSKNSSGTVVSNVAAACAYLLSNITT